jgi:ATP-dependent Zn protease
MEYNDAEKYIIAYHEAGHAVVAYTLKRIISDVGFVYNKTKTKLLGGSCRIMTNPNRIKYKEDYTKQKCLIALAGIISEELWSLKYNGKDHLDKLYKKTQDIGITHRAKDEDVGIINKCFEGISDIEKKKIIKEMTEECTNLVESNWKIIESLANYIIKYNKINHVEIMNIVHCIHCNKDPDLYFSSFLKRVSLFFRKPIYSGESICVKGFKLLWLFIKITWYDFDDEF